MNQRTFTLLILVIALTIATVTAQQQPTKIFFSGDITQFQHANGSKPDFFTAHIESLVDNVSGLQRNQLTFGKNLHMTTYINLNGLISYNVFTLPNGTMECQSFPFELPIPSPSDCEPKGFEIFDNQQASTVNCMVKGAVVHLDVDIYINSIGVALGQVVHFTVPQEFGMTQVLQFDTVTPIDFDESVLEPPSICKSSMVRSIEQADVNEVGRTVLPYFAF
mmetsp:Transcript_2856/g.4160  ORF Transcript_2856/g.4160 Transcript_2856/m.4160 type:complete len:221 (+) Transcript_2856:87-749(+)